MIDLRSQKSYDCNDLRKIVHILRSPGGCQWDQAQTHQSIRRNFLEEAYEVAEAIDEGDLDHLKEELGDVLLQVVFHSSIEEEAGRFDLDDVADGVCRKLIYRHPHVFGDVSVQSTDEILSNWEELKKKEKGQATQPTRWMRWPVLCPPCGGRKRFRKRPLRRALTGPVSRMRWTSSPRR